MLSSGKRALCAAACLALASTGLAACSEDSSNSSDTAGSGPQKIVVQQGGTGFAWTPMLVADENGYFTDEGLDVQLNIGGGGTQVVSALLSGDIQFGNAGVQAALPAVTQGRKLQIVAPMSNGLLSNLVVTDKTWNEIGGDQLKTTEEKLKALKGAVLGVEGVGSASDSLTRYLFQGADLDPDSFIKIQSFKDQNAILAAFQTGRIDGFVYTSPTSDQAVSNYKGHYLVRVDGELPELGGLVYTGTMINEEYARSNGKKTVQPFVNALAKGGAFIEKCPDEAEAILAKALQGLDGDLLHTAWQANKAAYPTSPVSDVAGVEKSATFAETTTGKELKVDMKQFVNNTFAEAAVKHLKDTGFNPVCKK